MMRFPTLFCVLILMFSPAISAPPAWLDIATEGEVFEAPVQDFDSPAIEAAPDAVPDEGLAQVPSENDTVAELRQLADEMRRDAERLRKQAEDQRKQVTEMSADWLDEADRIAAIEAEVETLKSQTCKCNGCDCEGLTEARVREICREEIQAVMSVRTPAGEVESRPVTMTSGSGQIQLAPGERLLAINGVPVNPISRTTAVTSDFVVAAPLQTPVIRAAPVVLNVRSMRPTIFPRFRAQSSCYTDANGNRVCPGQ